MSREEVKSAINELLDQSSEEVLQEVYDYLKTLEGKPDQLASMSKNLSKILKEDSNLLKRLAQ